LNKNGFYYIRNILNDIKYSYDDFYLVSLLNQLSKYNEIFKLLENINTSENEDQSLKFKFIGSVYNNQGKYDEALKYYFKSLEIIEAFLGNNHPNTGTSYNIIGSVYNNQGK